jgi:hypothetical protein
MMQKIFICLCFIFYGFIVLGQDVNLDSLFEPKLCGETFHKIKNTLGKQYYNEDWFLSDITLSNGEKVLHKTIKYNGYLDEVIWLTPDSFKQVELDKKSIAEFYFKNLNGKAVRFKRITTKLNPIADSTDIFVEVLYENRISLYAYRKIVNEGSVSVIQDGSHFSYDYLVPRTVYWLTLTNKNTLSFTKPTRRSFLKGLPTAFRDTVKVILRQNHLSIRSEDDLVKVLKLLK